MPPRPRRLLALAAVYDGGTRSEAARLGTVTLQIVRDWVMRFNAGGPEGLRNRKAPGPTPRLSDEHRRALAAQIEQGPIPALHGVVRWRLCDLGQWLWEELTALRALPAARVSVSKQTLSRELRAMGCRKLSARPKHHAQAASAAETFKKLPRHAGRHRASRASASMRWRSGSPTVGRTASNRRGQKNKITRRWARRGTRPAAPQDQRYASVYIFGAVCPKEGKGAALVLPLCNTAAMTLHLAEISAMVRPGKHAVLLLDQAGWHLSDKLAVPPNITFLPLPPKCSELNAMENIWQFLRGPKATPEGRSNWLSNRIFHGHDDIVDHCCHAWNKLVDQPWRITSVGLREWAHRS